MPRSKKTMGIGAVIMVLSKTFHPFKNMRDKYPNRIPNYHLENCLVISREMKNINRRDQAAILFCLGNHPNVEIYEVKRYTKAITEGPDTGFFQEDEELVTVNLDEL